MGFSNALAMESVDGLLDEYSFADLIGFEKSMPRRWRSRDPATACRGRTSVVRMAGYYTVLVEFQGTLSSGPKIFRPSVKYSVFPSGPNTTSSSIQNPVSPIGP